MDRTTGKAIDTALWAGQWILAAAFLGAALLKLFVAPELAQGAAGLAPGAPAGGLRPAGWIELALALAVILPSTTRVLPRVSVWAAGALFAAALLGAAMPESAAALGARGADLALAAVAAFVAWGRGVAAPLEPLAVERTGDADDERVRGEVERARQQRQPAAAVLPLRQPVLWGDLPATAAGSRSR